MHNHVHIFLHLSHNVCRVLESRMYFSVVSCILTYVYSHTLHSRVHTLYTLTPSQPTLWHSQVSFAKEPYKRDCILQKKPIVLRRLRIEATPQGVRKSDEFLCILPHTRVWILSHPTLSHSHTLHTCAISRAGSCMVSDVVVANTANVCVSVCVSAPGPAVSYAYTHTHTRTRTHTHTHMSHKRQERENFSKVSPMLLFYSTFSYELTFENFFLHSTTQSTVYVCVCVCMCVWAHKKHTHITHTLLRMFTFTQHSKMQPSAETGDGFVADNSLSKVSLL